MRKVAIVTDSTATLPEHLLDELNIHVVPVLLLYGNETYRDGIDITPDQVYQRLRAGEQIPTSAPPSVGDFLRVYATLRQQASGVLSIHMSPDLSATYGVAVMTSQMVDGLPIRVLNCQTAAMGQGFVVLEAARAAASGARLDEVLDRAREVANRVHLLFTLGTFKYLHRGGRIGGAAALMGAALQIKPILYLDGGRVEVLCKPRTKPRALRLILERIEAQVGRRPLHAAVLHAGVPQEAENLRQRVARRFDCVELYVTEFTPVMGAHTGPGLLGIGYYAE
jgi:DegV family protein with EDD domain